MKTLFTFALAGLLATSSFAANENEDLMELSSINTKFQKVSVFLKQGIGKTKIAIKDENGKMLHQRNIKVKANVMVPYNLDRLPVGEYQVIISTEDEELIYIVETSERVPEIVEYPLMAYGKLIDDHTINLAVIGLNEPGVDVKIRMERGDKILYEEKIDQAEGFKKNYVLNGIDPSEVYFELKDALGRTRIIHF
jgi:outer membrane lipoprotein-sorting protein